MMARLLLAVLIIAASIRINGGSPYKKSEPPAEIDEEVLNDEMNDDKVLVGDMVLLKNRFRSDGNDKRFKRQAFDDDYKWEKSGDTVTIPYTESGVDSKVLQRAIDVFNAKTCIRFVLLGSQANYVAFKSGKTCNAQVGYRGSGEQTCTLTSNCAAKKGKVLHEMMHILGFLHEQCRPDRNNYVTIHKENIKPGLEYQFQIIPGKDLGIPYDCDSILHYKATAFGKTRSAVTISSSQSSKCPKLGNDDTRLSLLDYKRVNNFYGCNPNPNYRYFKVKVVTDGSFLSGTDCFIYMKLHGTDRTSTEFELYLDNTDLFERNSVHTFEYMAYRDDLGPISSMTIRMVSSGNAKGWWPDSFTIYDPVNKQEVKFGNQAWLKPPSTYGPSYFPKLYSKNFPKQ